MEDRTKFLDWIATNDRLKEEAKQDLTNTEYALKLYNQVHRSELQMTPQHLKEPKFSDFYIPSHQQKNGELAFVGVGALALGYATFHYL